MIIWIRTNPPVWRKVNIWTSTLIYSRTLMWAYNIYWERLLMHSDVYCGALLIWVTRKMCIKAGEIDGPFAFSVKGTIVQICCYKHYAWLMLFLYRKLFDIWPADPILSRACTMGDCVVCINVYIHILQSQCSIVMMIS